MWNFILIALCLLFGFLVSKKKGLPSNSYKGINSWIINVALPAVALKYIPGIKWNFDLILPLTMPLIIWGGSFLFIRLLTRFVALDKKTMAAMTLTAGLGNTSFIGFPLTKAYFGTENFEVAVLADQASFLVMATLGVILATRAADNGNSSPAKILKKVLSFPPFLAFCLAFLLPLWISLESIDPLLDAFAVTLVPLALFSVGMQLRLHGAGKNINLISAGLFYKLILAPLILLFICLGIGLSGSVAKISIFEAAMAPMVTGAILATDYNLNPKLTSMILSIGIPVSFVTTFFWTLVLENLL